MSIRRCALAFENVLSRSGQGNYEKWQDQIYEFRDSIIKNELYPTGPIFYKIVKLENNQYKYTISIPVNRKVKIDDKNKGDYEFVEKLFFKDGLTMKDYGFEDDLDDTNKILKECAHKNNLKLTGEFYHISIDIYGEKVVQTYAPIKEEE